MGDTYANISVKGARQSELVDLFSRNNLKAVIGPEVNGWCCFAAEILELHGQGLINELLEAFSSRPLGAAMCVQCYDEDLLSIDLFKEGKSCSEYNSCPGCFYDDPSDEDLKPRLKNPEGFCGLGDAISVDDIKRVLTPEDTDYLAVHEVHDNFINLLKLPPYSLAFGFRNALRDSAFADEITFIRVLPANSLSASKLTGNTRYLAGLQRGAFSRYSGGT